MSWETQRCGRAPAPPLRHTARRGAYVHTQCVPHTCLPAPRTGVYIYVSMPPGPFVTALAALATQNINAPRLYLFTFAGPRPCLGEQRCVYMYLFITISVYEHTNIYVIIIYKYTYMLHGPATALSSCMRVRQPCVCVHIYIYICVHASTHTIFVCSLAAHKLHTGCSMFFTTL